MIEINTHSKDWDSNLYQGAVLFILDIYIKKSDILKIFEPEN